MIAGKVLMDRHAPAGLLDTAQRGYDDTKALIARWHGRGRLALCDHAALRRHLARRSSSRRPARCGASIPDVLCRSHIAENRRRESRGSRALSRAHATTSTSTPLRPARPRARSTRTASTSTTRLAARCTTRGHGARALPDVEQFPRQRALRAASCAARRQRPVRVALGTDVGGGTELLDAAHDAGRERGRASAAAIRCRRRARWWLATRARRAALDLDDTIGTIAPGTRSRPRRPRPARRR